MTSEEACSFCGTARRNVRFLVAGISAIALICDECVLTAMHVIVARKQDNPDAPPPIPQEVVGGRFVRSHDVDRHGGLVYAVATTPDLDSRRLKVGYTTRPIAFRLESFRTANPTVTLIGLWHAPSDGESIAHRSLNGRIRNTEVFHVSDVAAALAGIDRELLERWP